jgi:transposase-like protein
MSLQSPAPLAFEFRRYLSNPSCPHCGTFQLCPETSEFLRNGHIRHSWACDSCGQEFQTQVEVAPQHEPPGASAA